MTTNQRNEAIASKNDAYRRHGWDFMMTTNVMQLKDVPGLIEAVLRYDEFSTNSDPHHQHDFGSLRWGGTSVYWMIDYYSKDLRYGVAPESPECRRVLTIMLASDY